MIQDVRVPLIFCAGGPDKVKIVKALADAGLLRESLPDGLYVDVKSVPIADPVAVVDRARKAFRADWDDPPETLLATIIEVHWPVSLDTTGRTASLPQVVSFVETAPVEIVVGCGAADVPRVSFADTYCRHGWGVFFKGRGHDRFVSRRWLEHGPWLVHYGANDTTYVQFCDLAADAETQRAQQVIAHEQMGISPVGGFIQLGRPIDMPPGAYHVTGHRRIEIPVYGRVVFEREMTDMASIPCMQRFGPEPDLPVDSVAYVFATLNEARLHLHKMWLRGIDVVTYIEGERTVLTADYSPPRRPPEWVQRLEQRTE